MRPPLMRLAMLMLAGTCTLAACSPPAVPQPEKPPAPQADAMSRAIHAPLDKAKAVEAQAQADKEAQDKQIEAATQ